MKINYKLILSTCLLILLFTVNVNAQTTGTVFRDLNGNGTRDSVLKSFVEPRVAGVCLVLK
jgi:hypothetical protein